MEDIKDNLITSGYMKNSVFPQSIQHYGYQDKENFRRSYQRFIKVLNRITNAKI